MLNRDYDELDLWILLWFVFIIGYIINIIKIVLHYDTMTTNQLIVRCVGLCHWFIGSIIGWVV